MLTKATIRFLADLQQKKHRRTTGRFLVEGTKSVVELLESGLTTERVYATHTFAVEFDWLFRRTGVAIEEATPDELTRAGALVTNNAALAVALLPDADRRLELPAHELTLALADVADPGNVGTLIRLADWYGVRQVICSPATADPFSPKAVAASMGSFSRVGIWTRPLPELLASLPPSYPVFGADLTGDNVYELQLQPAGMLLMGSESHGLPPDVAVALTRRLHIPRRGQAESLNVAMAGAILLDHFFRGVPLA